MLNEGLYGVLKIAFWEQKSGSKENPMGTGIYLVMGI